MPADVPLTVSASLDEAQSAAVADLERRTVAADGGRLKLEWGTLRTRDGSRPSDVLHVEGDAALGFVGLYEFGGDVELAGMVDPAHRRRGIGRRLLRTALGLVAERGRPDALLVCPRSTPAGAAFARAHGGVLDHSEHAMRLGGAPPNAEPDPATGLRPMTDDDVPRAAELILTGFGHPAGDLQQRLGRPGTEDLVVEREGAVIGYLRLSRDDDAGGIYGFVIDAGWRGRGIGRDVLARAARRVLDAGASEVRLEVEVDNERALGLYLSVGFRPVLTEDYFRLAAGPALTTEPGRPR